MYIFLGYIAGFLGIAIGVFVQLVLLSSYNSFGVPYLSPYLPIKSLNIDSSYFVRPAWHREKRASFLNTKNPNSQEKISMVWKFLKGNK